MSRSEQVILTNLCMVSDGNGNILVQNRTNPDWPGVTFPGGHVEPGESFVESVIREVWEETGLTIENPVLCGIKQFPTDENERYVVLFFRANRFHGTLHSSEEGEVFWLSPEEKGNYVFSSDFEEHLRVFTSDNLSEFFYYKEDDQWKYRVL